MTLQEFWETLVDEGILTIDEMGRAQSRFAQVGGGLDTCIIETVILANEQWQQVMQTAAKLIGFECAPSDLRDAPDLEGLATLSPSILSQIPVLPSIDFDGEQVWIIPPVQPSVLADLKPLLATRKKTYLAREIDLWMTLNQLANISIPERFLALWRGEIPSLLDDVRAESPMPIARSTELIADFDTLGETSVKTLDNEVCQPGNTQPSTPAALGLAETADFETEEIHRYLAKKRLEKMLASSNSLQKMGSLTADMPKLRAEPPTSPPQ